VSVVLHITERNRIAQCGHVNNPELRSALRLSRQLQRGLGEGRARLAGGALGKLTCG